jgi:hypothetical protein
MATDDNGKTWNQRNNGIHIFNASKIVFQENSIYILSDSIVYCSTDKGKTWGRLKGANNIIFPADDIEYKSINNATSWVVTDKKDENITDSRNQDSRNFTLHMYSEGLVVSNSVIHPFGDSLYSNSFAVHDLMLYFCTPEGVYYKPALSLFEEHIFDFFIGGWGHFRINENNILFRDSPMKNGIEILTEWSCGGYFMDTDGKYKEKIPRLSYKTAKVILKNEIDTTLACNGFVIKDDGILVDGNETIPITDVYMLSNNCVYSELQKLFLINWKHLLVRLNNTYYLY